MYVNIFINEGYISWIEIIVNTYGFLWILLKSAIRIQSMD